MLLFVWNMAEYPSHAGGFVSEPTASVLNSWRCLVWLGQRTWNAAGEQIPEGAVVCVCVFQMYKVAFFPAECQYFSIQHYILMFFCLQEQPVSCRGNQLNICHYKYSYLYFLPVTGGGKLHFVFQSRGLSQWPSAGDLAPRGRS